MLDRKYFRKNTLDLAKDLLGNILVRKIDGQIIRAKIVETEAYLGVNDRACHTFLG
ncbi:DNA-3-methyladenine glycosylase [Anaerococcus obesiensis]